MAFADAPVEDLGDTDSTMLEARRRLDRGQRGPLWLLARTQSAGQGRRGRAWASLAGNFMGSFLTPADRPAPSLALLGFTAGLAVAETIDTYIGQARARVKWPNDVHLDGAKIAGLLIDSSAGWFVLGLGVNLAHAPVGLDQPAICLAEALGAPAPAPREFLGRLCVLLDAWDKRFLEAGFEPIRNAWLARAHAIGAPLRVMRGEAMIEGAFAGISLRGELELRTTQGVLAIAAGDVLPDQPGPA